LHPKAITLIGRKGKALSSFADLKGDKVNVGNLGAGLRAPIKIVLDAFGMQMSNFALAAELKGSKQPPALVTVKSMP